MTEGPSLVARLASPIIWLLAGGFLIVMLPVLTLLHWLLGAERIQFLERFYSRAQLALTFNRQVHHVHPDVDPNTPYIFIQNHSSHLDHVAVYNATPHFKQGIELETHFDYPFYGWFMKARGTIPVPKDRNGALQALRGSIRDEMERGHSILGFPEGHRTLDGRVGKFYDGIFRVAIELGAPIVPVAVTGLYDVMHKGSLTIRPCQGITVFVEAPISTVDLTEADIGALRDRTRAIIAARVDAYFDDEIDAGE